jgi:hypothetical protein
VESQNRSAVSSTRRVWSHDVTTPSGGLFRVSRVVMGSFILRTPFNRKVDAALERWSSGHRARRVAPLKKYSMRIPKRTSSILLFLLRRAAAAHDKTRVFRIKLTFFEALGTCKMCHRSCESVRKGVSLTCGMWAHVARIPRSQPLSPISQQGAYIW